MRFINYLFLLSVVLSMTNCVVPVQMPRITMSENFTQNFDFGATEEGKVNLTKTLGLLIGPDRVEQLIASPEGDVYITQMLDEKILAKGVATLTFSLVPNKKTEAFYISGSGSYHIIDTTTSKVYFSANFYLIDSVQHPMSLLDTGAVIPIYFNQVLINHIPYEETASVWEHCPSEHIKIEAVLNRSVMDNKRKPMFGIDYNARHRISIGDQTIGSIKFRAPSSPFDKIVDIRGMKSLIRRDYHKYRTLYEGN